MCPLTVPVARSHAPLSQKIFSCGVGDNHSLVLCEDGLYTFGWGLYGQLGHGNKSNQTLPKRVAFFDGKVRRAGAGGWLAPTRGALGGMRFGVRGPKHIGQDIHPAPSCVKQARYLGAFHTDTGPHVSSTHYDLMLLDRN